MNKKPILILLLSILSCFSLIRTGTGGAVSGINGYLGKNLEVDVWLDTNSQEIEANNTIIVSIEVTNYSELYVKNLQLELDLNHGAQNFSVTLVRNSRLPLTAGSIGGFVRDFSFTPNNSGDLSIRVSADYEYVEGNQTVEQVGMIETYGMTYVNLPGESYNAISSQNRNLQNEIGNLNTSYQNLMTSYQDQRTTILFLTTATAVFIFTTIVALIWGETRFRRLRKIS